MLQSGKPNFRLRPRILTTADGSTTLRLDHMNECYHSMHGAIRESEHVFINAGLENCSRKPLVDVLELGLGTGLNALLTQQWAEKNCITVSMVSIEKFPLGIEFTANLVFPGITPEAIHRLHDAPWHERVWLSPFFSIEKQEIDVRDFVYDSETFDVVYFDAFSPEKQPELWTDSIFEKMFNLLWMGGALVTYCAKGDVRRGLQRAGFKVEKMKGPPGKREMLRAIKPIDPSIYEQFSVEV